MTVLHVKSSHPESQGPYVVIDKADFDPAKHDMYIAPPPAAVVPPPPPPPPAEPNPLDKLPKDWREKLSTERLRDLASAASGRMPDNREQAVAIIAEKLAAK